MIRNGGSDDPATEDITPARGDLVSKKRFPAPSMIWTASSEQSEKNIVRRVASLQQPKARRHLARGLSNFGAIGESPIRHNSQSVGVRCLSPMRYSETLLKSLRKVSALMEKQPSPNLHIHLIPSTFDTGRRALQPFTPFLNATLFLPRSETNMGQNTHFGAFAPLLIFLR